MAETQSLLLSRRFAPLFWCQFFSAFSDNFLKNALVFLILFKIGGSSADSLITLAAAVFIAPYFFLSALGGEIADRYDKAVIAQRLKLCEIGVAFIAIIGFVTAFGADPVRGAVRLRRDRLAVRPDQIRHPARPAAALGIAGRQRAGRGRDLSGDPARHHRRRHGGQGRRRPGVVRRPDAGVRAAVLGVEPVHPEGRLGRARPRRSPSTSSPPPRGCSIICAPTGGCGGARW